MTPKRQPHHLAARKPRQLRHANVWHSWAGCEMREHTIDRVRPGARPSPCVLHPCDEPRAPTLNPNVMPNPNGRERGKGEEGEGDPRGRAYSLRRCHRRPTPSWTGCAARPWRLGTGRRGPSCPRPRWRRWRMLSKRSCRGSRSGGGRQTSAASQVCSAQVGPQSLAMSQTPSRSCRFSGFRRSR